MILQFNFNRPLRCPKAPSATVKPEKDTLYIVLLYLLLLEFLDLRTKMCNLFFPFHKNKSSK